MLSSEGIQNKFINDMDKLMESQTINRQGFIVTNQKCDRTDSFLNFTLNQSNLFGAQNHWIFIDHDFRLETENNEHSVSNNVFF